MTSLSDNPPSPLREDDRDTAVRRLQEAYAEGHVSHEELSAGLDQVLAARTHGELAPLLASLPEEKAGTTSTIAAAGGRIQRRGAWRVPRTLKVESAFGKVRLDLSRAVFEHPVVDIELHLGTGKAKITVPHDAVVDVEGLRTGWKDSVYTPRRHSPTGGPTIRITGAMGYGRLKIRHARR
ncbi:MULTISPECIES: DUF1707 SHOCT-like domain-containing protein [Streptomyces]|uniref:DUF1707 domain-containing protein n=2 Tax=Streptomyces TaxID=1883 RepID=A0ABU2RN19_9ACTN|nr:MULTISPECIES: DUF1707 domain-containing protein [unclassified Streptomyces]MBK3595089.1 DUF1707 domain-containing protein [Streptomyces sp. MBT51]MDT0428908.1 DUF1707 domain-containing protein [Streptomyces sp. DSM 41770]